MINLLRDAAGGAAFGFVVWVILIMSSSSDKLDGDGMVPMVIFMTVGALASVGFGDRKK